VKLAIFIAVKLLINTSREAIVTKTLVKLAIAIAV